MSSPQTSHVRVRWRSVSLPQRSNISFRVPECQVKPSLTKLPPFSFFKLDIRRPAERARRPPLCRPGYTLRKHASQGGGRYFWQGDWASLSSEQQLHVLNRRLNRWRKNLKGQEGEHRRTSEVGLARTADRWLQRPGYEHDGQLRQRSLNPAPVFIKTLWSI